MAAPVIGSERMAGRAVNECVDEKYDEYKNEFHIKYDNRDDFLRFKFLYLFAVIKEHKTYKRDSVRCTM